MRTLKLTILLALAALALPAVAAAADPVLQTNSKNGSAILTASDLTPGDSVSDTVTIGSPGGVPTAFALSKSSLVDTPGGDAAKLSDHLRLVVEDTAAPAAQPPLYSGAIAAMGDVALGTFAPGESRTYRFTVSLPVGESVGAVSGASMSVAFDWLAQPPAAAPATTTTPTAQQPAAGGAPTGGTEGATRGSAGQGGDADDGDVAGAQQQGGTGSAGGTQPAGGGGLPFTGVDLLPAAIAGMLLLLVGLSVRRRAA